jgi:hypothetical protein
MAVGTEPVILLALQITRTDLQQTRQGRQICCTNVGIERVGRHLRDGRHDARCKSDTRHRKRTKGVELEPNASSTKLGGDNG